MKTKYPRKNRFLIKKSDDGESVCYQNCDPDIGRKPKYPCISKSFSEFLERLDGKTSPYAIDKELSGEQVREFLRICRRNGFLDSGKRVVFYGIILLIALIIPRCGSGVKRVAVIWNRLLSLLWLPTAAAGLWTLISGSIRSNAYSDIDGMVLIIAGMVVGLILHEWSHAAACLAYGGDLMEAGVMLYMLMPGAYVRINYDGVKSRFRRAQICGAGIEANLFLAGISLLTMNLTFFPYDVSLAFGIINLIIAVLNLSMVYGFDGMNIFLEMLLGRDKDRSITEVLDSRFLRRELAKCGINGYAVIAASYLLILFQLIFPILIISQMISFAAMFP